MVNLSTKQKVSYSMGGLALNLANLAISQWLLKLYVPNKEHALMSSTLFAFIFLIGRLTDGITEPLAGYWSDNCKSKWGRRMPFIIFGFIPVSIITFLLWTPPFPNEYHWLNGVYIFVIVQMFFIAWSLLANPYMSLLPELTSDLKERVNISTMQAIFIMVGTLLFGVMGPIKEALGWVGIGTVLAVITMISFIPTILTIKEKKLPAESTNKEKTSIKEIFKWAKTTFQNKAFVVLLTATSLFWFSLNLLILIIPFWVQYYLNLTDSSVLLLMAPFLFANVVFFFVFNLLAKKYGKYKVFLLTLSGSGIMLFVMCFTGTFALGSSLLQSQIAMGLIGIFVSGFLMLPAALLADVIDYDQSLTGMRREGIYFGMQAIFQKLSIGMSIAIATYMMYIEGGNLPTIFGLKTILVLGGISATASFLVFLKYPLREKDGKIIFK